MITFDRRTVSSLHDDALSEYVLMVVERFCHNCNKYLYSQLLAHKDSFWCISEMNIISNDCLQNACDCLRLSVTFYNMCGFCDCAILNSPLGKKNLFKKTKVILAFCLIIYDSMCYQTQSNYDFCSSECNLFFYIYLFTDFWRWFTKEKCQINEEQIFEFENSMPAVLYNWFIW